LTTFENVEKLSFCKPIQIQFHLMRTIKTFKINSLNGIKSNLLTWSQQFSEICFLDSNEHQDQYSNFDAALAVDGFTSLQTDFHHAFDDLEDYQSRSKDWLFGYLTYDLKNSVENLSSKNSDRTEFPELFFFQPKKLIFIKADTLIFHYLKMVDDEIEEDFEEILNQQKLPQTRKAPSPLLTNISKTDYLNKIGELQRHIHRGDCYEANFCMEFFAEKCSINPFQIYDDLNTISKAPFSAFLRNGNNFSLCASPERYLQKNQSTSISQPIKGTARRDLDLENDSEIAAKLQTDEKERAENIMIVDLVRNDLSRTAKKGSVNVKELCGLYSFPQVHQLISTVSSEIGNGVSPVDLLKTTFPMGSMTGAPKISVMQITEKLESFKRGLYSGSIGYFSPNGDFDFNVVIRSILYNAEKKCLSAPVGGAITAKSIPEQEYEECLLKAKAMREVLS